MASASWSPDVSLLGQIPEQDLADIVDAIRQGAEEPGDALGFGPEALSAIEQMALAQYRGKKYKEAAVLFGFVLRMNSKRASAWRALGACAQAVKDYGRAAQCYAFAIEHDPADVVSGVFLGETLCLGGERDAGLAILEDVIARGTTNQAYAPYVTRARAIVGAKGGVPPRLVLLREGKRLADEAADALASEQGAFDPSRELSVQDMLKNPKLSQAVAELSKFVQDGRLTLGEVGGFSKQELDGAYAVACQYTETGQLLPAIQITGFLIMLSPYEARYYQLAGICLQRMRQYDAADYYYGLALCHEPDNAMTLVYQGECNIMANKIEAGLALVRRGIEAAEGKPEFREMLERGRVLEKRFASHR